MTTSTDFTSYEHAVAAHRWVVPERYNIAADVCDKGSTRATSWRIGTKTPHT